MEDHLFVFFDTVHEWCFDFFICFSLFGLSLVKFFGFWNPSLLFLRYFSEMMPSFFVFNLCLSVLINFFLLMFATLLDILCWVLVNFGSCWNYQMACFFLSFFFETHLEFRPYLLILWLHIIFFLSSSSVSLPFKISHEKCHLITLSIPIFGQQFPSFLILGRCFEYLASIFFSTSLCFDIEVSADFWKNFQMKMSSPSY